MFSTFCFRPFLITSHKAARAHTHETDFETPKTAPLLPDRHQRLGLQRHRLQLPVHDGHEHHPDTADQLPARLEAVQPDGDDQDPARRGRVVRARHGEEGGGRGVVVVELWDGQCGRCGRIGYDDGLCGLMRAGGSAGILSRRGVSGVVDILGRGMFGSLCPEMNYPDLLRTVCAHNAFPYLWNASAH